MSVDFPFLHRVAIAVVATASFVAGASGEVAAGSTVPILYRIFLDDGGTLTSYGDYARVGQRVVLSLPVASFLPVAEPRTQLVSISAGRIDWTTTERYADAARYAHYAATRGEADYAALSRDVARSLNAIALLDDPVRALNLARVTRQRLVEWSQHSFGYREHDTHQIVSLLDEANSGLSIEVGEPAFELSFVATPPPPPPPRVPLRHKPSLQEIIADALTASALTPVPAEQLSLLQTAATLLADARADDLPRGWLRDRPGGMCATGSKRPCVSSAPMAS